METLVISDELHGRIVGALGQCPLFRALKPEHFPQLIKVAELLHCEPGETLVRQGDPADAFFVVVEGEAAVKVEKGAGESVEIGRIPNPSSVGEIGLLLGEPRTASVVAVGEMLALKFGAKAFEAMFQKIPTFGMGLSAGLAHRLQEVSGKVQLPHYDVQQAPPSADVLAMLPMELMQRHRVLPLKVDGAVLTLGFVDDPTSQVMSAVRSLLPSLELRPVSIDAAAFSAVLSGHGGVQDWRAAAPAVATPGEVDRRSPRLDKLLERVVAEGASDLHLSAGLKPHWRVDGDMQPIADAAVLGAREVFELLEPVMSARHRDQFTSENDTDFAYAVPGSSRFRVNVFRDSRGIGAVLRQIPTRVLGFEQLGLPDVLKSFCELPKGLVLVTGPTGSGKSTTLAAMIDHIKKTKRRHIVTLEDPIEFVHESSTCLVNQREIGGHTKSFARALRAALREDPDIVLVGEMRDLETIALTLEVANTGHLVFATLHTNSAVGTVDRIVDQFPGDQQSQIRTALADVLKGVVAQTLCKKVDGGRVAALEILVVSLAISNLIREQKTNQIPGLMQASKGMGMSTLNEELMKLVDGKKIDLSEAKDKAVDKEELMRRFRSGLWLQADPAGGRFRVQQVDVRSAGAEAGFERGDFIVEIDGRPGKEFTVEDVKSILRADGRHVYQVDRGGKRRPITMELKRAY
jgi:twitching motility protein PilT